MTPAAIARFGIVLAILSTVLVIAVGIQKPTLARGTAMALMFVATALQASGCKAKWIFFTAFACSLGACILIGVD